MRGRGTGRVVLGRWNSLRPFLVLFICGVLALSASLRASVTVEKFTHHPLGFIGLNDPGAPACIGAASLPNALAALANGTARVPPDLGASGTSWEAGYRFMGANRGRSYGGCSVVRGTTFDTAAVAHADG